MKRQKRDKLERAFHNGYNAGVKGHSQDICPYQSLNSREMWLGGWRQGWASHKMTY